VTTSQGDEVPKSKSLENPKIQAAVGTHFQGVPYLVSFWDGSESHPYQPWANLARFTGIRPAP